MALIIETGAGLTNSQSYATEAELVAFAAARGITLPATVPLREALLLAAMDYMETLAYKGSRYTLEQALEWPRVGVVIEDWLYDYANLPTRLKQAQLQLAVDSQTVPLLPNVLPGSTGAVLEERVEGAVSVKYAAPSAPSVGGAGTTAAGALLSRAAALLRPLLRGMALNVPVSRG